MVKKNNKRQKLIAFIEKLKASGATFNEAYIEVSAYVPEHLSDAAVRLVDAIYLDTGIGKSIQRDE
jgi:hypothetical protein